MQNELTELCRDFQVCLPQTAEKLADLLKGKSLDVPITKLCFRTFLFPTLNEDKTRWGERIEYNYLGLRSEIEKCQIEEFEITPTMVFNYFELWLIAECFGFNEREFEFNSNQFITQVKNGNYLYGVANLEYWHAEALAQFILLNVKKR